MRYFIEKLWDKLACCALAFFLAGTASATLSVNVISPSIGYQGTASGGTPVFYEAYATSPECASGIAAMRIYTAAGVSAYTVNGGHLETFIALPLGNYSTVVQAWDNCGAVAKTAVPLTVTTGNITVYLPYGGVAYGPVHIAASSQTGCNNGIAAMRLYTAPYIGVYTIDSNALDTYVTVPPDSYSMTIVAWDKCGGVFTYGISSAVTGAPNGYLYGIYGSSGSVGELQIGETANIINPNGTADPPQVSVAGANSVVVDPGGWFVYASGTKGIYAFQIDPENGSLVQVSGSPVAANGVSQIVMDPSGNYLYVVSSSIATYRINRSSGALTATGQSVSLPSANYFNVAVDTSFFYVLTTSPEGQLWGYSLNVNNGALTPIAGLPISIATQFQIGGLVADTYRAYLEVNNGGTYYIYGYNINPTSGALTAISGSPFSGDDNLFNLWGDWEGRYLWGWSLEPTGTQNFGNPLEINSKGQVTLSNEFTVGDADAFAGFTEDLTGNYVFAEWTDAIVPPSAPSAGGALPQPSDVGVQSYYISNGGQLIPNSNTVLPNNFLVQAIGRGDPN